MGLLVYYKLNLCLLALYVFYKPLKHVNDDNFFKTYHDLMTLTLLTLFTL